MVKTGAVTVIQRFNSALDVAPHFHTLFMDGIYRFPAAAASLSSILCLRPTTRTSLRSRPRCSAGWNASSPGWELVAGQRAFPEAAPLLVAVAEASARGVIATGPRRGCRVLRVRGAAADVDAFVMGRLCAQVEGYNFQAATRVAADDRDGS